MAGLGLSDQSYMRDTSAAQSSERLFEEALNDFRDSAALFEKFASEKKNTSLTGPRATRARRRWSWISITQERLTIYYLGQRAIKEL
jgi:hypothetical protein